MLAVIASLIMVWVVVLVAQGVQAALPLGP
jgi:hypothetical protein